jgi:SLT domain-containing protein
VTTVTQGGFDGPTTVPGAFPEFRARGGPIRAGRPYIVGEEGPELVIPSGAGRVMSAPQTQSMLGGSTYMVTVNMPPGADGDQVVSALRRWERSNGPLPVGVR